MPLIPLADADDPRVAEYRDLPDPALVRRRGLFVAEGHLVVRRLLESPRFRTRSVLLTEPALARLRDALEPRLDAIDVYVTSRDDLGRIGGFNFHRGCLALGERPAPRGLVDFAREDLGLDDLGLGGHGRSGPESGGLDSGGLDSGGLGSRGLGLGGGGLGGGSRDSATVLVLALDGIANADNVGGIFRNAAAFGARGILLDSRTCDPLYRKAIRTSMGTAFSVPFWSAATPDEWHDALVWLRAHGFALLALAPERHAAGGAAGDTAAEGGERGAGGPGHGHGHGQVEARPAVVDIEAAASRWRGGRVVLLAGSEGSGLDDATRALASATVSIRMAPGVDSLNVATATGIVLHRFFDVSRSTARRAR